jgi:hypothetical protein
MRIIPLAVGALLCAGMFAAAQDKPAVITSGTALVVAPGQKTYLYNVMFSVNGVTVRADRAVIEDREVALEGNVRMTLPPPK